MVERVSGWGVPGGWRAVCGGLLLAIAATAPPMAGAAGGASIYTCTDAGGKRITSDRPIVECNNRDQRLLNTDGSVRHVVRPTPTADERSEAEAREREADGERKRVQEAVRHDRTLLARFPNEALHRKARDLALADVHASIKLSQTRLERLATERKPLIDESEFYVGKPVPTKLKLALDANDAALEAQKTLMQNQQLEAQRIDQRYDLELDRLRRLWAGAVPGSLGPLASAAAPATR